MNKRVEWFAAIKNGRITLIAEAFPAHELKDNQIELTKDEYTVLKGMPDGAWSYPSQGIVILQAIQAKISTLEGE